MNRWEIPDWLELEVRQRDKTCVYCGVQMSAAATANGSRHTVESWEHIINDVGIVTRENIVLCCVSCNSSKGAKLLTTWLQSAYCRKRGISSESVAPVVRQALLAAKARGIPQIVRQAGLAQ